MGRWDDGAVRSERTPWDPGPEVEPVGRIGSGQGVGVEDRRRLRDPEPVGQGPPRRSPAVTGGCRWARPCEVGPGSGGRCRGSKKARTRDSIAIRRPDGSGTDRHRCAAEYRSVRPRSGRAVRHPSTVRICRGPVRHPGDRPDGSPPGSGRTGSRIPNAGPRHRTRFGQRWRHRCSALRCGPGNNTRASASRGREGRCHRRRAVRGNGRRKWNGRPSRPKA